MFSIAIDIPAGSKSGIEALDWRRSHGLPDGVQVDNDIHKQTFPVTEEFARKWFQPSETTAVVVAGLDDLIAAEVSVHPQFSECVNIVITRERAEAIFIKKRADGQVYGGKAES